MSTRFVLPHTNALIGGLLFCAIAGAQSLPNLFPFANSAGILATFNKTGAPIDLTGPFFQSLGTNGRSCATCHRPAQAWTLSADEIKLRFDATHGLDPLFRTNDGSNCDHSIETSTVHGRRSAYSLLLDRGLIRVALSVPAAAEFDVVGVINPYGCNELSTLSLYRRPLPSTNLTFLSAVMWDGRESSPQTGTQKITYGTYPNDLLSDLAHQALDATNGHAHGSIPLTAAQQQAIVDMETNLTTAQIYDYRAGLLDQNGATGGPQAIASQSIPAFFIGINDPLGGNPHGDLFTPAIFNLFDAWAAVSWPHNEASRHRASIARGQALFNSKPIEIVNVAGLNDDLGQSVIPGTCGTCHDSPNAGNHSVSLAINIGVADLDSPLDVAYLPTFTLRNKTTQEIKTTTDPGRALITGQWKDVGKFKGPVLRGLAARAPYFHNGSARTLGDVVDFYDKRFNISFTHDEKADLIAFLSAL